MKIQRLLEPIQRVYEEILNLNFFCGHMSSSVLLVSFYVGCLPTRFWIIVG